MTDLLAAAGGCTEPLQALLVGGYFGTWVESARALRLRLAREELRSVGCSLGLGRADRAGPERLRVARVRSRDRLPGGAVGRPMRSVRARPAGDCGFVRGAGGRRRPSLRARAHAPLGHRDPRPRSLPSPRRRRRASSRARSACSGPGATATPRDDCPAPPAGLPLGSGAIAGRRAPGARATMSARLRVNPITCEGHGLCAELLPELIRLDDWGYPILDASAGPRRTARAGSPCGGCVSDAGAAARGGLSRAPAGPRSAVQARTGGPGLRGRIVGAPGASSSCHQPTSRQAPNFQPIRR